MDYKEICEQVCEVAMEAGDYIGQSRLSFSADKVEEKGPNNLVSFVDREAEKLIVARLKKILPEAEILGEEGSAEEMGGKGNWIVSDNYRWVIDPLDGTINFVHAMPPFSVSIALMRGKEVLVGVVYEITGDECFYAWQGSPAYLNGREISVSAESEIANSLVITGMAYTPEYDRSELNRLFDYFNANSHGARRTGSAAANLVYAAAGRAEAFFQTGLSPWDVAAGTFIVERAGGRVTEYGGGDNFVYGASVLATNGALHEKMQKIVNS